MTWRNNLNVVTFTYISEIYGHRVCLPKLLDPPFAALPLPPDGIAEFDVSIW